MDAVQEVDIDSQRVSHSGGHLFRRIQKVNQSVSPSDKHVVIYSVSPSDKQTVSQLIRQTDRQSDRQSVNQSASQTVDSLTSLASHH